MADPHRDESYLGRLEEHRNSMRFSDSTHGKYTPVNPDEDVERMVEGILENYQFLSSYYIRVLGADGASSSAEEKLRREIAEPMFVRGNLKSKRALFDYLHPNAEGLDEDIREVDVALREILLPHIAIQEERYRRLMEINA